MTATLFIDADACPVKDEAYKVAARHGFKTFVVSNSWIRVPQTPVIEQIVVDSGPDVADDWIAERCGPGDVVVTNDIPLADRVLKAGGAAVAPNGRVFSPDMIGSALASRSIGEHLRSMGEVTKGPAASPLPKAATHSTASAPPPWSPGSSASNASTSSPASLTPMPRWTSLPQQSIFIQTRRCRRCAIPHRFA